MEVYQCLADNYTARNAADEFSRSYFDKPRAIAWFTDNRFMLVDGVAVYTVIYRPAVKLVSAALWIIIRE